MATVNIVDIAVGNNPCPFTAPFQFDITFECLAELPSDLEWRVVYVGSAESSAFDQELASVLVGPVPVGTNKFRLDTAAPDPSKIPAADLLGATVVLITCSYKEQEFIRVGYYISNQPPEPVPEGVAPAAPVDLSTVVRTVVADKPRVTRFEIAWV